MSEPPPPRYRVVERGRRLEVIDTRAGVSVARPTADVEPPVPVPAGLRRHWPWRTRFDGTMEVVTHRLYDAKAPRTIRLDPVSAERFGWATGAAVIALLAFAAGVAAFPWLFAAPVAIHMLGATPRLRKWMTRRIDAIVAQS